MKTTKLILLTMLLTLMGALSASAQTVEAYALLSTDGKTLTFYYDNLKSSCQGKTYELNTGSNSPGWYDDENNNSVEKVVFNTSFADAHPTSCSGWFAMMENLKSIEGIGNLKTDKVEHMEGMFLGCRSLESLVLSSFNTANVTSMYGMFLNCTSLESLDLSSFNTDKVTNMSSMFYNCKKLKSLDVSSFNTEKVTDMSLMFGDCISLESLDVSSFNTEEVTDMSYMFYDCTGLTTLDLSGFTFSSITSTSYMLNTCYSLQKLIIPSSASYLDNDACGNVGKKAHPCLLKYPEEAGADLGIPAEYDNYFLWKSGCFTDIYLGDANGDGAISVADVMIAVCNVRGMEMSSFKQKNADVNKDGQITITDVMLIVKMVASGSSSAPRNANHSMSDAMEVTAKGSELTLHLTGTGSYTASQMMLTLPEGCHLESAQMVSSRDNGHSVRINELGNGQYRVVIYGAYGMPFRNSCTDLVRLQVAGNHEGDVSLSDIQVVDAQTNTFLLSDVSGIATGINSIGSDISDDGDWYTIQGQKVATPTRGVYIRNGRKVVVR